MSCPLAVLDSEQSLQLARSQSRLVQSAYSLAESTPIFRASSVSDTVSAADQGQLYHCRQVAVVTSGIDPWRLIIAVWPLTPVILFRLKCKFYYSAFSVRAFQTCNTSNVLKMELRGPMLAAHIRHSPVSFLWASQMLYLRPGPEGVRFLFLAVFIKLWSFFLVFSLRFFSPLRTDPIARAGPRLLHAIVVGCVGEVAFLGCRHCVICSSRTATIAPMLASCHSSTTWVVAVD